MNKPAPVTDSYEKLQGAINSEGVDYERKLLALTAVRLLAAGLNFRLGSNVKAAGTFDDLVLRLRKELRDAKHPGANWDVTCVQLKHKKQGYTIVIQDERHGDALLGLKGDFSLVKYSASFASFNIEPFCPSGAKEDVKFIIYTNADIVKGCLDEVAVDGFLDTGGRAGVFVAGGEVSEGLCHWVAFKKALSKLHGHGNTNLGLVSQLEGAFQKVKNNDKLSLNGLTENNRSVLMDRVKLVHKEHKTYVSFLSQLLFYVNQARENDLDRKIMDEIRKVIECKNELFLTSIFSQFLKMVIQWHKQVNDCFYLDQTTTSSWLEQARLNVDRMANTKL